MKTYEYKTVKYKDPVSGEVKEIDGLKGENYKLTDSDKQEIANLVGVDKLDTSLSNISEDGIEKIKEIIRSVIGG